MKTRQRISRKDKLRAGIVVVVSFAVISLGILALQRWQEYQQMQTTPADESNRKTVEYQGTTYVARDGIESYLFMGIDVEGPAKGSKSYIGGGQADVQLLLVVDRFNRTWQVLQINRDSMVEVPVLGVNGKEVGTEYQQIALAHSYGDGLETSCENNVTAVSRMLQNQTIQGYVALNMDAISIINDQVGGVEVTVLDDFSQLDPSLVEGQTVTLTGTQALTYIRGRQGVGDETNLSRMVRQEQYLNALYSKLAGLSTDVAVKTLQAVDDYMVTDMNDQWLKLMDRLEEYTKLEPLAIDGESYLDEQGSTAYQLDEDSLKQVMIQLFYEPMSKVDE